MNIKILLRALIGSYIKKPNYDTNNEQTTITIESEPSTKIPIKKEDDMKYTIQDVDGIGPKYEEKLSNINITTVNELANKSTDELQSDLGISEDYANRWISSAKKLSK